MKLKRTYTALVAVTAIIISITATSLYAQQRMHRRIDGPGVLGQADNPMRLFRMAEELDLSKEQRDSIVKIMDDTRPGIRDNMFRMMDARKELRDLMQGNEDPGDRKLRSLTRDQADAMAEMMYLQMKMRKDIRNVLTEEQLAKMETIRDRRGFRNPQERREGIREWRRRQPQD